MAEEEVVVENKKKSPVVIIAALVVVGLILAGGISYFVTTKVMTDSVGQKAAPREPGIFIKLGDPKTGIIVNVGGVKSGRFLKVGVVLEMNPGDKKNFADGKINTAAETKVLDSVVQVLRAQKIDEFEPGKQDDLKQQLKTELNKQLGEGSVYEVYITNFVFQ